MTDVIAGSVWGHRTIGPRSPRDLRRNPCACGQPRTHTGFGDGVALMGGCEMCVRRWVRDGVHAARPDVDQGAGTRGAL